jgi:hypothetical protein
VPALEPKARFFKNFVETPGGTGLKKNVLGDISLAFEAEAFS